MTIRHTNRIARRPLDMAAVKKANAKLWRNNPQLHGRKLTMGLEDYLYRQEWMDAYLEFLEQSGRGQRGTSTLEDLERVEGMCERERAELDEKEMKLAIAEADLARKSKRVDDYRDMEFRTERPSRGRGISIGPPPAYGGDWESGGPGGSLGKFSELRDLERDRDRAILRRNRVEQEVAVARRNYEVALRRAARR
jgi:hypothetical protein